MAQSFFSQLPAPLATDLAMVAGVLAAHPRQHIGEAAIARLGRVAHTVFHLINDDDDDDEGGGVDDDGGPQPGMKISLPKVGRKKVPVGD